MNEGVGNLSIMMECESCCNAIEELDRSYRFVVGEAMGIYATHHPLASDDDIAEAAYACLDAIAEAEGAVEG